MATDSREGANSRVQATADTTERVCVVVDPDVLDSDRYAVVAVQEPTSDPSDDWYAALGIGAPASGPRIAELQGARILARGSRDHVTNEILQYVRDHQ